MTSQKVTLGGGGKVFGAAVRRERGKKVTILQIVEAECKKRLRVPLVLDHRGTKNFREVRAGGERSHKERSNYSSRDRKYCQQG